MAPPRSACQAHRSADPLQTETTRVFKQIDESINGRSFFQEVIDAAVGIVNTLTAGLFDRVLGWLGADGWYNKDSLAFQLGGYAGQALLIR